MVYYSARLLFIILVDDGKAKKKNDYDESVILFKARDFAHAFERALEIGKVQEKMYQNGKGQDVRWVLTEIINLDIIGRKLDAVEVSSKIHSRVTAEPISPKQRFRPERSKPNPSF